MATMNHTDWDALFAEATGQTVAEVKEQIEQQVTTLLKPQSRSTQGKKLDASYRRDLLEKKEFFPDNSRIGKQSAGMTSYKTATYALILGDWDRAAWLMVAERDTRGMGPIVPVVTIEPLLEAEPVLSRFIGPLRDAVALRPINPISVDKLAEANRLNNTANAVEESKTWKTIRQSQSSLPIRQRYK